MGLFKDVLTAFKPSNIARGLDAARNPPTQAEIEASLQHLTPEQRAAYDANMAEVERGRREAQAAHEQAQALVGGSRVLEGPAGRHLYGQGMQDPAELEARVQAGGVAGVMRDAWKEGKRDLLSGARQSFNIPEVKELDDPAQRAQVAAAERAARDAARAPYLAPERPELRISRLSTRGRTQLAELLTHLDEAGFAAHPEAVFGVYRVPDRISQALTPYSEAGRVVEWDIVHEPLPAGVSPDPAQAPLVASSFRGDEQWVARVQGEPSVLDEDLALAYCLRAGIGPEQCLGLARISEFRALQGGSGDGDGDAPRTLVKGVVAIHPQGGDDTFAQLRAEAPLTLPADVAGPAGVHVEVLDWATVGRVVHPKVHHPPPVPSAFPYLPSTPQELLRAYLEIVGLRAADCYSAQATVHRARELAQGGFFTTNLGAKQPCADGTPRMRTHGCELLVLVYRDRPAYVAGRERWDAYMADVLQANLRNGVALRPAIASVDPVDGVPFAPLRAAIRAAEFLDGLEDWGTEKVPPYRYCWPPAEPRIL